MHNTVNMTLYTILPQDNIVLIGERKQFQKKKMERHDRENIIKRIKFKMDK